MIYGALYIGNSLIQIKTILCSDKTGKRNKIKEIMVNKWVRRVDKADELREIIIQLNWTELWRRKAIKIILRSVKHGL